MYFVLLIMAVNGIDISGFKEFEDKLNTLATKFPQDIDNAAKFAAGTWEQLAKRSAPKDVGFLSQRISSVKVSSGIWELVSPSEYSPFMEWGTKLKAAIPADIAGYAAEFKGSGSKGDAKALIYAWVLRKGIPASAQWPIFISIMRTGVRPHPFFFIHKQVVQEQLISDLKQMIDSI